MAARILANLLVMGSGIMVRAFAQAYRQALTNAAKNGTAQEAVRNIRRASKNMTESEARQILGVAEKSSWEDVLQLFSCIKNPKLQTSSLEQAAVEAGIDLKKPVLSNEKNRAKWASSSVLSEEEVKYAMYGAYSCYQIASSLCDFSRPGCRIRYLYKISTHYVRMGGITVKTIVVDSLALLILGLFELKGELLRYPNPVVEIDIVNGDLLLLYAKKQCLLIRFSRIMQDSGSQNELPSSLVQFLGNESITFVVPRHICLKSTFLNIFKDHPEIKPRCCKILDVRYLAAKVLMKPKLLTGTLNQVAAEAGVDITRPIIDNGVMCANGDDPSSVMLMDEVKLAVYEVHSCYQIIRKLTDMVGASMYE